jgi:hypothetical protein
MSNEAAANVLGSANLCMGNSGLAAGTTTTITTAALVVCIQGRAYSVSAASNGTAITTDYGTGAAFIAQGPNTVCVYVIGYDAAGNRRAFQGPVGSILTYTAGETAPDFPVIPAEVCAVGYIVAKAASNLSGTWTFGTNNNSSVTGMTWDFVPCVFLPARPPSA